jgi:outer membrane protein
MSMSRLSRWSLGAGVCALIAAGAGGEARADSLIDAIVLAYQSNPTLQQQRAQLRATDETYVQARATGYRINITGQSQANWQWTHFGPNSGCGSVFGCAGANVYPNTNSFGASVLLTQPVFTFGQATAKVNQAEANVLAAREDLRRVENQVMLNVIQAYADVRADEQILDIRQQDVAVLKRQVEESRARFDVGEVTRTDVAQSEAQLAQTQASLSTALSQLASDRALYAAVVGQSPTKLEPAPAFKVFPENLEQAFDTVEQNNPQIRAADYVEQGAQAFVSEVKAQRRPNVFFQSRYQYNQPLDPWTPSAFTRNVTAGVILQAPIFTGGQLSSQIREAIEQDTVANTQLELTRRTQQQALSQNWNTMLGARGSAAANTEQVRAATIAFEGTQAEQQVGLRTTLEVLNAEEVLRSAQLQLIVAQRDEYISQAAVLGAMGMLEASYLVPDLKTDPGGHSFNQLKHSFGYVPLLEDDVEALDSIGQKKIRQLPAPVNAPIATAHPDLPAPAPAGPSAGLP